MKNIFKLLLLLPGFLMLTNGSINLKRDSGAKTVKMPLLKRTIKIITHIFIQFRALKEAVVEVIKNATLTKAKNELASKVKSFVNASNNINQSGEDGGNFDETFNARIENSVSAAVETTILLKSEWLSYGRDISGKEVYEFWGVYRIEKRNVK